MYIKIRDKAIFYNFINIRNEEERLNIVIFSKHIFECDALSCGILDIQSTLLLALLITDE